MKRTLALAIALSFLTACGSGGGSTTPNTPAKTQTQSVMGSVVISIPLSNGQSSSAKVRYPQFVSPNASSVSLSINGGAAQLFNVAAGSSLCTTVAGSRNCTLTFGAPAGSDTFVFVIFAGAGGTGTQLASATTTQTIATGTAFNFTVALNAAVGTIVANFMVVHNNGVMNCPDGPISFNGINEGCAGSAPLTITVDDPSGATITGSAPYATPISITGNDPSLSATPNQFTAPGQTVTLAYTGAPFAASFGSTAVVTLTAGGQTAQVSIPVLRQYLYVANSNAPLGTAPPGNGNIAVYAYGASGAAAPVRTLAGGATGITTPIKPLVDTSGNLYVLDNNIPISTSFNPTIRVFAPDVTGNVAPSRQITNLGTVTGNQACSDMTFDPTGNFLFVSCGLDLFVFPVTASGAATSSMVAELEDDRGDISNGLAFDPAGNLYVADQALNAIRLFNVPPIPTSGGYSVYNSNGAIIASGGAWSPTVMPFFVAVDNSGALYAPVWYQNSSGGAPDAQAQLGIWKSGNVCNDCNPSAFLTGAPFTTVHAEAGIVLDSVGNVYVDNPFTNAVYEFSPATIAGASLGTTGTILRTLNNNASGATGPLGIAIGP
jgi:hypothetical protein